VPGEDDELEGLQVALLVVFDVADGGLEAVAVDVGSDLVGSVDLAPVMASA
jgi:hypothetical protein